MIDDWKSDAEWEAPSLVGSDVVGLMLAVERAGDSTGGGTGFTLKTFAVSFSPAIRSPRVEVSLSVDSFITRVKGSARDIVGSGGALVILTASEGGSGMVFPGETFGLGKSSDDGDDNTGIVSFCVSFCETVAFGKY
jgi:hypothetical protein